MGSVALRTLLFPGLLLASACRAPAGGSLRPSPDLCSVSRQPAEAPAEAVALVEIPLGDRVKYEFDVASGRMVADRILPDSLPYPANYGTFPCTMADDGDPLDVLILTDVALASGTLIRVRPVAVLRMVDRGAADDKIVAVPVGDAGGAPSAAQQERLRRFFSTYKGVGADLRVGPWEDADVARALLRDAVAAVRTTRAP